jgi:holo-[acyl-carrier protein] synthase
MTVLDPAVHPVHPVHRASTAFPQVLIGTDIVAVERLERLIAEQPDILPELFTAREMAYCAGKRRSGEHFAARFAAKEAVLKALGTGLGPRMAWTDVEVVNEINGRPRVRLHSEARLVAQRHGVRQIDVSMSHIAGLALANAALVCEPQPPVPRIEG